MSDPMADEREPEPLVLRCEDVARLLQVPEDTVRNLHRTGQLRGVLVGRHLRWKPEDVRRFVIGLGDNDVRVT